MSSLDASLYPDDIVIAGKQLTESEERHLTAVAACVHVKDDIRNRSYINDDRYEEDGWMDGCLTTSPVKVMYEEECCLVQAHHALGSM